MIGASVAANKNRNLWYGIDEELVRWAAKAVLVVGLLVVASFGYLRWESYSLEREVAEVLERARGLTREVEEAGGRANHRSAIAEASAALSEAHEAWNEGHFREARSRGEVGRGLLLNILDSIRNPGRKGGDARFIYVEGVVELRRGETGAFHKARARDLLFEGDYVRSSSTGSAEILFGRDGALFTVRPDTLLKVNRTQESVGRPQSVGIQYGWVDLDTSGQAAQVETEWAQLTVQVQSGASVALDRSSGIGSFAIRRGSGALKSAESGEVMELGELEQVVQEAGTFKFRSALPPPPTIRAPADQFDVNLDRRKELELSWSRSKRAVTYSLQVSRSRLFTDSIVDVNGREKNSARLGILGEGSFYWRVASSDSQGRKSPWSETKNFRVLSMGSVYWEDTSPPELVLSEVYVNGRILIVTGKTEPGVRLDIDGQEIAVEADGSFSRSITHSGLGLVPLVVTAMDAAGNRAVARREVLIESL